jgi:hypothetical protein
MKCNEILTELADAPYKIYTVGPVSAKSYITYYFETDDGTEYKVDNHAIFTEQRDGEPQYQLEVAFLARRPDGWSLEATGESGARAVRVFSTVLECVKRAIKVHESAGNQIDKIAFGAAHDEPSRVALYKKFAQMAGRYLPGWKYGGEFNAGFTIQFFLVKSNQNGNS